MYVSIVLTAYSLLTYCLHASSRDPCTVTRTPYSRRLLRTCGVRERRGRGAGAGCGVHRGAGCGVRGSGAEGAGCTGYSAGTSGARHTMRSIRTGCGNGAGRPHSPRPLARAAGRAPPRRSAAQAAGAAGAAARRRARRARSHGRGRPRCAARRRRGPWRRLRRAGAASARVRASLR